MIKTEIEAYLNDLRRVADPKPSRGETFVRAEFYVTPITPELAQEMSGEVKEALFRKTKDGWIPRSVANEIDLDFSAERQQFKYRSHKEFNDGALLTDVVVDHVSAVRAYPDKPDLRLRFRATFQADKDSTWDFLSRFWKANDGLLLQFEEMDPSLFEPPDDVTYHKIFCLVCDSRATVIDQEGDAYCENDRGLAPPGREQKSIDDVVKDGVKLGLLEKRAAKNRLKIRGPIGGNKDGVE